MAEKNTAAAQSFEQALARLEQIVADMEGGQLSLEKMLAYFEEGNRLVKYCTDKLNEVEKKIELLVAKDGQLATEPFTPAAGGEDQS